MKFESFLQIGENIIFALALLYSYQYLVKALQRRGQLVLAGSEGILFGLMTIYGALHPFQLQTGLILYPGVIFIALCGFFGGLFSTLIALVILAGYHLLLGGGEFFTELAFMASIGLAGILAGQNRLQKWPPLVGLPLLGILVALIEIIRYWLLKVGSFTEPMNSIQIPAFLFYPAGVFLFGSLVQIQLNYLKTIEANEARYRTMADATFEGIIVTQSGVITEANQQFAQMTGYDLSEIYGMHLDKLVFPEDKVDVDEVLARGDDHIDVYRARRKDGSEAVVETHGRNIMLHGRMVRITTVRDITERVRAESAQIASQKKFLTLFESANDAIFLMDGPFFVDCNPKTVQLFGCTDRSEVLGRSPVDFSPEFQPDGLSSQEKAQDLIRAALLGNPQFFYWLHTRKDGSKMDAEVSLNKLELEGKSFLQAIVRDITLRKQAEDDLRTSATRSAVLARISARLNASQGLQELLDAVCEELAIALQSPIAVIWLMDNEKQSLTARAAHGLTSDFFARIKPTPNEVMSFWKPVAENIYYAPDIQLAANAPNTPLAVELNLHTGLNCWFYYEGEAVGILSVYRYERDKRFPEADLTLVRILSNEIAIAIYNAQLFLQVSEGRARLQALSAKLVDVQEAERRHLAIELHDEIGQELTQVKMSLDRLDPSRPDMEEVETARELTLDLMERVRSLSLELRPSILDDLGLLPAFLWHLERFTELSAIPVDFKPNLAQRRFSPLVESTAYRILQESLTNIARHSGASQVTISLWADDERLGLQVEDNGKGFDEITSLQKLTGGLSGMRERANLCGGRLTIDSQPGKGTYISLELPLTGEPLERRNR